MIRLWICGKMKVLWSFFNFNEVIICCVMGFVNGRFVLVVFVFSVIFIYFCIVQYFERNIVCEKLKEFFLFWWVGYYSMIVFDLSKYVGSVVLGGFEWLFWCVGVEVSVNFLGMLFLFFRSVYFFVVVWFVSSYYFVGQCRSWLIQFV